MASNRSMKAYFVVNAGLYAAFLSIALLGLAFGLDGLSQISAYNRALSMYGGLILTIMYVAGIVYNVRAIGRRQCERRAMQINIAISAASASLFLSVALISGTKVFVSSVIIYVYITSLHWFHAFPIVKLRAFVAESEKVLRGERRDH